MNLTGLLIVVIIGLVLFGSHRLPSIGNGLGRAIGNFKRSLTEPEEIDVTPEKKENGEGKPKP